MKLIVDNELRNFKKINEPWNSIKGNTCIKDSESCIDIILISRSYSFQNSCSFKTGVHDHHCLIYEVVYVTIVNPAFYLALHLAVVHFRGELQHAGDVSEQKIKCSPVTTREIGGVRLWDELCYTMLKTTFTKTQPIRIMN